MTGTRKIHVLIVDDDPLTRLMASEALRESGYSSVEAEDGLRALALFDTERPDVRYPVNLVAMNADTFPLWVERWGTQFAPGAHTIGLWAWELAELPPPSWVAINRENAHAHLVYGLSAPVLVDHMSARDAPMRYLAAIESAGVSGICDKPFEAGSIRRLISDALQR